MKHNIDKTTVDKSNINRISFSKEEILNSENAQIERKAKLKRSLTLGNLYKQHVKIKFVNQNKQVLRTFATVWALTEKYVILKGGRMIPLTSIITVDLC